MPYESINPYDGKLLESFKEHTDKELEAAVSTAATCFTKWRHKSLADACGRDRKSRWTHACERRRVRASDHA